MNRTSFHLFRLFQVLRRESCRALGGASLLLFSLLLFLCVPGLVRGEEIKISEARLGLDGSFKVGRWAPVEFDVSGPEGTEVIPVLRAADPDGRPTLQPLPVVTLSSQPTRVQGLVRSGRLDGSVQIQIYSEDPDFSRAPLTQLTLRVEAGGKWRSFRQAAQLWATIGKQPLLEKGFARWNRSRSGVLRLVELPEQTSFWNGDVLDSVDALVLNGDVIVAKNTSQAIRDWVKQGGRLIIGVGDAESALRDSPLAEWLPVLPSGRLEVTKLSGFSDLVPRSSSLRTLTTLPAAQFVRNSGTIIASGLAEPLAIRAAYGRGFVTMVAIRLDVPPLVNWESESQGHLAAVLAGLPDPADVVAAATARSEAASELNPAAVTDLQIQLNQSLDHFSEIRRSSHWQVMGWIALFALVIGPLDYYLVTSLLKRPEWTWGTLVAWSLLGAALATGLGDRQNQKPAVARQIDLADLDLPTGAVSVHSWYGFYSEQSQRLPVTIQPKTDLLGTALSAPQLKTTWISRPSEGFRGMYRTGGIDDSQPAYQFSPDQSGIMNLPLEVWSSGAVAGSWTATAASELPVTTDLFLSGINRLSGTVQHRLAGELTDWVIAYGNFAYFDRSGPGGQPAPLAPGQVWDLSKSGSNLLRGRLISLIEKGTMLGDRLDSEAVMSRTAYNPLSPDPFKFGLAASFYKVLGGESYTGLQNQSLNRLDLSDLLDLNRAVLFGRMTRSPSLITVDNSELPQEDHTILVRILMPVKPSERSSDAPPTRDILEFRR